MNDRLLGTWDVAWSVVGATPRSDLKAELLTQYKLPHRHFHTAQHLCECFDALAWSGVQPHSPGEFALAVWFHDAVIDLGVEDNEQRSAEWARRELISAGASESAADRVAALVLATARNEAGEDADAQLLLDVDAAVLAAPDYRFAEFVLQSRQELAHVGASELERHQASRYREMLSRKHVFRTEIFREALEPLARGNIERYVSWLSLNPEVH